MGYGLRGGGFRDLLMCRTIESLVVGSTRVYERDRWSVFVGPSIADGIDSLQVRLCTERSKRPMSLEASESIPRYLLSTDGRLPIVPNVDP